MTRFVVVEGSTAKVSQVIGAGKSIDLRITEIGSVSAQSACPRRGRFEKLTGSSEGMQ